MAASLQIIEDARKKTDTVLRAYAHEKGGPVPKPTLTIPVVIQTLLDRLGDEDLAAVVTVYRDAMLATRRYWVDEGKTDKGRAKGHWVTEPDHKTRIAAANMVAAYMEGLPLQRQLSLRGEFHELGDMLREMRQSGEASRLLPVISVPSATERRE